MLATLNSRGFRPVRSGQNCGKTVGKHACRIVGMTLLLAGLELPLGADPTPANPPPNQDAFARQAEAAYKEAKKRFQAEPNNEQAEWQFGRACFDWADFATSKTERARIAQEGIDACRRLVDTDTGSALGHYYLGMNLGQLARTKTLGALKIVPQMEEEFKAALGLDPTLDYGGSDRNLGLLYLNTPGWPTSIGSKSKARLHFQSALKLSPGYPENLLNMIEAELKWGDHNDALRESKSLDEIWPAAQKQFAGPHWAPSWLDWEQRREELRKKLHATDRVLETPRMR
jgi:tetratricopeptide (TPR) repeat protein